jgi:2'-5' RNA ligase
MRLFLALDLPDSIRARIARFLDGVRPFAPDARWMHPDSLHITLKFIGEYPDTALEQLKHSLSTISAPPPQIHFRGYGFFPTPKSARVFWIGMDAGPELSALAATVDATTAALGIPKEDRPYSPHLTLARGSSGSGSPRQHKQDSPNRTFQHLQEKLAALPQPEFGTMTPREFFLYQSRLSPKGSTYTKLAAFPLERAQ